MNMAPGFQAVPFESVRILRLQPGDVVVVKTAIEPEAEQFDELQRQLQTLFPDHKVAVLQSDSEIQVLREGS